MITPMAKWIEMVRGVIAIVVAIAVALIKISMDLEPLENGIEHTGTSMRVMLDLKSESGSDSSTRAC
jgi:hypothetical protein